MPLVSCILATKNRPRFLSLAVRFFLAQTLTDSELIIIDDSMSSSADLVPANQRIRYVYLQESLSLGAKLNLGISMSSSAIIQKIDDDDFYHPLFLEKMVGAFIGSPSSIVAIEALTVLMLNTGRLHDAGRGWFAGGTLCFPRKAWEACAFRDVPRRVDVFFLEDHPQLERVPIDIRNLYVLVRHNHHTWTRLVHEIVVPVNKEIDIDVDTHLASYPMLEETLEEFFGEELAAEYQSILSPDHQATLDRK